MSFMNGLISEASENSLDVTAGQLLQDVRELAYVLENAEMDSFYRQEVLQLLREKQDHLARVLDAKMQHARQH